jgi:pyruvate ferredoxin oxidoreductase delta subunit
MKEIKIKMIIGGWNSAVGQGKTGSWRSLKPTVDESLCTSCGTCSDFCPDATITVGDAFAVINYDYCKGCGVCANECPFQAITMSREE